MLDHPQPDIDTVRMETGEFKLPTPIPYNRSSMIFEAMKQIMPILHNMYIDRNVVYLRTHHQLIEEYIYDMIKRLFPDGEPSIISMYNQYDFTMSELRSMVQAFPELSNVSRIRICVLNDTTVQVYLEPVRRT